MARIRKTSDDAQRNATALALGGHRIRLTSLDKVVYPEVGTTKSDVIDYYTRIAPLLVPFSRARAATRKQWVDGVGTHEKPGEFFFHKNIDSDAPGWIARKTIHHADHINRYPLINDAASLVWFAQRDTLEFHVPQWRFGRGHTMLNPDRLVFDLDPGEGTGLSECAEVAFLVRDHVAQLGLETKPVTSGSKGIHLYAELDGSRTADDAVELAHRVADAISADRPDLVVSNMRRSGRTGKVLIDWSQNHAARTTVVPYSLRGRLHPTVASPRTWSEIENTGALAQLDYREVLERTNL